MSAESYTPRWSMLMNHMATPDVGYRLVQYLDGSCELQQRFATLDGWDSDRFELEPEEFFLLVETELSWRRLNEVPRGPSVEQWPAGCW